MDSDFEENFISQRLLKQNGLIGDLIKCMGESIDRYTIIIYGKHDLIIYIKNLGNQSQTNVINFFTADMKRYDIILE
jgi:hypothetical protein